jgi:hypothetical protein
MEARSEPPPDPRCHKGDMQQVPYSNPQISRATAQNAVILVTQHPGFVPTGIHKC